MLRYLLPVALACSTLAGCSSAKMLSDRELDVKILNEMASLDELLPVCQTGDVSKCEATLDKLREITALIDEACARNAASPGCQGKAPAAKLSKMLPLYIELANGDPSALKRLQAVIDQENEAERRAAGDNGDQAVLDAEKAADEAEQAAQAAEQATWDKTTVTPQFLAGTWVTEVAGEKDLSGCSRGEAITYNSNGSYSLTGESGQFTLKGDVLTEAPVSADRQGKRMLVVKDDADTMLVRESGGEPYRMFRCNA